MRERTGFPRAVIEKLPDLKLLITTGARNASIDVAAAKEKGVTVCGTGSFGSPTSGIAIGLMLELTRRIGYENARMHAGETWQTTIGPDLEGLTLGTLGLGKLGTRTAQIAKAFGMKAIAWSQNLTAGEGRGSRRRLRLEGGSVPAVRLRHHPRGPVAALARARRRRRVRADEADGLHHQHLARPDHRRGRDAGGAARARRSPAPASTCSTSSRCRRIIRCARWTTSC